MIAKGHEVFSSIDFDDVLAAEEVVMRRLFLAEDSWDLGGTKVPPEVVLHDLPFILVGDHCQTLLFDLVAKMDIDQSIDHSIGASQRKLIFKPKEWAEFVESIEVGEGWFWGMHFHLTNQMICCYDCGVLDAQLKQPLSKI